MTDTEQELLREALKRADDQEYAKRRGFPLTLAERLRAVKERPLAACPLFEEAADEIERLREALRDAQQCLWQASEAQAISDCGTVIGRALSEDGK